MLKKLVVCGTIMAGATAIALGAGLARANDGPSPIPKTVHRSAPFHSARAARKSLVAHNPRPARKPRRTQITRRHDLQSAPIPHFSDERRANPWWNYMISGDHHKKQANETFNVIYLCGIDVLGLDHLLLGKNESGGKCAQSSFNEN